MKAVVYERYGSPDVLELRDVEAPAPVDGEVLVRVAATTVTTADWRLRASAFPGVTWLPGRVMVGLFRPKKGVLGGDFAGEVQAAGPGATRFEPGDRVFGFCGTGAHAELVAVSESAAIAATPENLGDEEAAAVPFGALAALVFLRDFARLRSGQRLLVVGASGGVGSYAVQLGRHFGAEVDGVCGPTSLDLVRSLGAGHVFDYTREDFTRSGRTYDVILDTVGATSFGRCKASLTERGVFVPLNFGLREAVQALATSIGRGRRVLIGVNGDKREDLELIAELLRDGRIRPVIDRSYPLDAIAEAHRHVEGRHRLGSVVVAVAARPAVGGSLAAPERHDKLRGAQEAR
jgi:NADPH:quinone reductase-like Zn-dependent oxidoreductase